LKIFILSTLVAHLGSHPILDIVIPPLTKVKQLAISVQRTAKVAALIGGDLFNWLVTGSKK